MPDKPKSFIQELNPELRRELIRALTIGLAGLSLLFSAGSFFVFREIFPRMAVISGITVIACAIVLWLTQKKLLNQASTLLTGFLWILVTAGTYTAGGFDAPIFTGYLIVILGGWILLGRRGGIVSFIASTLASLFILYSAAAGTLPQPIQYSQTARFGIGLFFFFVVFMLQRGAAEIIRDTMRRGRESEERYRSLLENIPSVTYINDLSYDARTTYVSPQVVKLLGYSKEEFVGDPSLWTKIVFPSDLPRVMEVNQHTVETGEPFNLEYRLLCKDGRVIWVRDEAILVRDENNEPQYWLGVWTDITSIKNAENDQAMLVSTLVKRNNQMQTASEVSSAANSILDLRDLLPNIVELLRSHFGYYYVGVFLSDQAAKRVHLRAGTGAAGMQQMEAGHSPEIGPSSMIGWCVMHDQARIALDVGEDAVRFKNPLLPLTRSELALPLRSRGNVIGAMTIQSEKPSAFTQADITALQTMADQIANSIENARLFNERSDLIHELEDRNAELERFAYTASHDLKAPLVTIRGFLGYLREDAQKGDMDRFEKDMRRVESATTTMQTLLNDLLELSRVGRVANKPELIALSDVIQEAMNLVVDANRHGNISLEVQAGLPTLNLDRTRMIEVYQNLVSNAIKFMGNQERPKIEIGLQDQNGTPLYYVRDNGMGIEPRYHEQVFGLFNRLNMDIEGTGIGLALVKRIIEVHGGKIWVESQGQDSGSTFYFTLTGAAE